MACKVKMRLFTLLQKQTRCKYRVLELDRRGRRSYRVSYVVEIKNLRKK